MGLCRGHTDQEWRESALELVQERFCHDHGVNPVRRAEYMIDMLILQA
jgi:hypothetical protein